MKNCIVQRLFSLLVSQLCPALPFPGGFRKRFRKCFGPGPEPQKQDFQHKRPEKVWKFGLKKQKQHIEIRAQSKQNKGGATFRVWSTGDAFLPKVPRTEIW